MAEVQIQQQVDLRGVLLENMQHLLDQLENQELYHALSALHIIFYRVQVYSYQEIEGLMGINKSTLSVRMSRLRKK